MAVTLRAEQAFTSKLVAPKAMLPWVEHSLWTAPYGLDISGDPVCKVRIMMANA